MISCKQCQKHLVTYVHHELPPKLNRKVAQHLDRCETCYSAYMEQKRLVTELRRSVPVVGNGRVPSFERFRTAARLESTRRMTSYYPLRYGMVMVVVTVLLLIPFALGKSNQVFAGPPTQPAPLVRVSVNVTAAIQEGVSVAFEINQTPAAPARPPVILPVDVISTP